jgi:hypothetical protein
MYAFGLAPVNGTLSMTLPTSKFHEKLFKQNEIIVKSPSGSVNLCSAITLISLEKHIDLIFKFIP